MPRVRDSGKAQQGWLSLFHDGWGLREEGCKPEDDVMAEDFQNPLKGARLTRILEVSPEPLPVASSCDLVLFHHGGSGMVTFLIELLRLHINVPEDNLDATLFYMTHPEYHAPYILLVEAVTGLSRSKGQDLDPISCSCVEYFCSFLK